MRWIGVLALLLFAACSAPVAPCGPGIESLPLAGQNHVTDGTPVDYTQNPPASGDHSAVWQTPWGSFDAPVPRERWVHNLEHGGIVLAYNCPDGCAAEVQLLSAIMLGLAPDKYNARRVILTPDPKLPTRFAAVAWLWRWTGATLDADLIRCFIGARYDKAPESVP